MEVTFYPLPTVNLLLITREDCRMINLIRTVDPLRVNGTDQVVVGVPMVTPESPQSSPLLSESLRVRNSPHEERQAEGVEGRSPQSCRWFP